VKWSTGLAIVTIIAVTLCGSTACFLFGSHPSDAALERVFRQHRRTFDHLAVMAEEDRRVVRIARDFTWLEDNSAWPRQESDLGFSTARWDEYREMFRELSLDAGTARTLDRPDVLFLIASAKGLVTGGSDKGYAYSPLPLEPLGESLDSIHAAPSSGVPAFKRLEGPWYLYVRWDD
jgi:hypothetical protein